MLILTLLGQTAFAQIKEYTVPEFVAEKEDWSDLIGDTLRIEGRFSSFNPNAMSFQKCDLMFYLPEGTKRPLGRYRNLEATGELKRDGREWKFAVESVRTRPDDFEQLQLAKSLLPKNDPEPWFKLGEKTIRRAEFYEDDLLKVTGQKVLEEAISIEKSRRKNPSPEFLAELATKAAKYGVDETLQHSLKHESLRRTFEGLREKEGNLDELLKEIEQSLPGSRIPLTSLEGKRFEGYEKKPVETFAEATRHGQQQLSRFFYLQVLRAQTRSELKKSGMNGDRLAKSYARQAPDDPAFARELREQALMYRTENILDSSRTEVLSVAGEYRKQGKEEMAETALTKWLEHRVTQLDRSGPSDYLQTALDFDQLLDQHEKAEKILLAGIKKYPEDRSLIRLLQQWDYTKTDSGWVSEKDRPDRPVDELQQAMKEGRVITGMSREQVASILGAPKTMTRLASKGENLLIWNYPDVSISIRFEQKREYRVVHVGSTISN